MGRTASAICSCTTERMVDSLNPCRLEGPKASSRFGPTFPLVAASASVWQPPHFETKSFFPFVLSPVAGVTPPAPQPEATSVVSSAAETRSRRTRS